jgi:hypothetical protein
MNQPCVAPPEKKTYIVEIKQSLREARKKAYKAVDFAIVEAYWLSLKRILEEIQKGEHIASFDDQVIKNISKALTAEFGTGFSKRSICKYR